MTTTPACTACGARSTKPDPFYYVWVGRHFGVQRCRACTHQFVYPAVTPEDQARIYADSYFQAGGDWAVGHFEGLGYADAGMQLRKEAREILDTMPLPHRGRLLDIGCAGGLFLDAARTAGYHDVVGIELNASMAEHARRTYGLEVITGSIESIAPRGRFDVITILDCLEHIPQPLNALRNVAQWLRPGGMVMVRGPLSNSRVGRLKESARRFLGWQKQLPGYPLDANMWNPRSLTAALTVAGFEDVSWVGLEGTWGTVIATTPANGVAFESADTRGKFSHA